MTRYLIDTNVMLAASAVYDLLSNLAEAEPADAELRELVYEWLRNFEMEKHVLLLDEESLIRDEYERNMRFNRRMRDQEYGLQVLQAKLDKGLVEYVPVDAIEGNGEKIAILSDELTAIVTDREDRKWVAAASSAFVLFFSHSPIVYAAESDWYRIEADLAPHNIIFERLLPVNWYED